MNKPLWALAGIPLLAAAGVAGVIVAAPDGEEEALFLQEPTPSRTPCPSGAPDFPDPLVTPSPPQCLSLPGPESEPPTQCIDANGDGVCTGYAPDYLIGPSGRQFSFPPEPTPPYSCIYMVVDAQLVCEPMNGYNFPHGCAPIMWQDRAACLPPGAQQGSAIVEGPVGPSPRPCAGGFHQIDRGHSIIKWGTELCDFYVAPEDEVDFRGLRELFLPGGATPPPPPFQYSCRYIVIDGELLCLPMDNAAVRACRPVDYQDRSGCAPEGAQFSNESADYFDPVRGEMIYKSYAVISRGNSRIKYRHEAPQYYIAPEDALDFAALEAVFHPN